MATNPLRNQRTFISPNPIINRVVELPQLQEVIKKFRKPTLQPVPQPTQDNFVDVTQNFAGKDNYFSQFTIPAPQYRTPEFEAPVGELNKKAQEVAKALKEKAEAEQEARYRARVAEIKEKEYNNFGSRLKRFINKYSPPTPKGVRKAANYIQDTSQEQFGRDVSRVVSNVLVGGTDRLLDLFDVSAPLARPSLTGSSIIKLTNNNVKTKEDSKPFSTSIAEAQFVEDNDIIDRGFRVASSDLPSFKRGLYDRGPFVIDKKRIGSRALTEQELSGVPLPEPSRFSKARQAVGGFFKSEVQKKYDYDIRRIEAFKRAYKEGKEKTIRPILRAINKIRADSPLGSRNVMDNRIDNNLIRPLMLPGNKGSIISGSPFGMPTRSRLSQNPLGFNPFVRTTITTVPSQELGSVMVRDYLDGRAPMITRIRDVGPQFLAGGPSNNSISRRATVRVSEAPAQEIIGTSAKAQVFISPPDSGSFRNAPPSPSLMTDRPTFEYGYQTRGTVSTQGPRMDFTKAFQSSQPITPSSISPSGSSGGVVMAGGLTAQQVIEGRATAAAFPGESRTGEFFRTRISEPISSSVSDVTRFLTRDVLETAPNLAEYNAPQTSTQEAAEKIFFENFKIQRQTEDKLTQKLEEIQLKIDAERANIESGLKQSQFTSDEEVSRAVEQANERFTKFSTKAVSEFERYQKDLIKGAQQQAKTRGKEISDSIRAKDAPLSFKASQLAKSIIPEGRSIETSQQNLFEEAKRLASETVPEGATYDLITGKVIQTPRYSDAQLRRMLAPSRARESTVQFLSGAGDLIRERPLELVSAGAISAAVGGGLGFLAGGPAGAAAGVSTAFKILTPALLGAEAIRIGAQPGLLAKARTSGQIAAELTPVFAGGFLGARAGQALRRATIRGGLGQPSADVKVVEVTTPQSRSRIIRQLTYDYNSGLKAQLGLQRASDLRTYKASVKDPVTGKITTYVYVETGKVAGPIRGEVTGERFLIGAQIRGGRVTGKSVSTVLERADEKITDLLTRSFVQQEQIGRDVFGRRTQTQVGRELFTGEKITRTGSVSGLDLGDMPARVSFLGRTAKTKVPRRAQILTEVGEATTFKGQTIKLSKEQAERFFTDLLTGRQARIGTIRFPTGLDWEVVRLYPKGAKFKGVIEVFPSSAQIGPTATAKSFRVIVPRSANVNLATIQRLGGTGQVPRPIGVSQQIDIRNVERGLILDRTEEALLKRIADGRKLSGAQKVNLKGLESIYGFKFTAEKAKLLLESLRIALRGERISFADNQLSASQALPDDEFRRIANLPRMVGGGGQGSSDFYGISSAAQDSLLINPNVAAPSPAMIRIRATAPFGIGRSPALGTVQTLSRELSALSIPNISGAVGTLVTPLSLALSPSAQSQFMPLRLAERNLQVQFFNNVQGQEMVQQQTQSLSQGQTQVQSPGLTQIQPQVQQQQQQQVQVQPQIPSQAAGQSLSFQPFRPFGFEEPEETEVKIIKGKKKKKGRGFRVEIRRRGKFRPLSEFALPREEALALGAKEVLETSAATFRIRPSDRPIKSTGITVSPKFSSFFRAPKSGARNVFVQRRGVRIKSPGEIREISLVGVKTRRANRTNRRRNNPFF